MPFPGQLGDQDEKWDEQADRRRLGDMRSGERAVYLLKRQMKILVLIKHNQPRSAAISRDQLRSAGREAAA